MLLHVSLLSTKQKKEQNSHSWQLVLTQRVHPQVLGRELIRLQQMKIWKNAHIIRTPRGLAPL